MSQPDAMMTPDSISPGITSIAAIPAINAQDGTVNIAGRDLTFITNNYNVDPNCDQGMTRIINLWLKLIICLDKIYKWLSAFITSTSYHGALKVRLEDTGLWFIDGPRFARWKATADDFVWICGARMYSHHLRIIGSKSTLQLVRARPS
jgi:hypothetical protein